MMLDIKGLNILIYIVFPLPNKSEFSITPYSITWEHIFSGTSCRTVTSRSWTRTAVTFIDLNKEKQIKIVKTIQCQIYVSLDSLIGL